MSAALLARDRALVLGAAGAVALIAAAYTIFGVGMQMSALEMTRMAGPLGAPMEMGTAPAWGPFHALSVFAMWWLMMVAMMVPSAAPTLLLFDALKRAGGARGAGALTGLFAAGYLGVWAILSAAATGAQWALGTWGALAPAMMTLKGGGAAAVLALAGLWQLTPVKRACLRRCREPARFLARWHRPGRTGALVMGLRHGAYCTGCCWALMALLFVGGVMNLWWIAGLAALVAVEKLAPFGAATARLAGLAMIAGAAVLAL